jgi:uridine kinase
MQNQVFTITDKHRAAAKLIFDRIISDETPMDIITVTGEVGTGKSTISYLLAKLLKNHGIRVKIMDLDNYYKISPLEREKWRQKHGISNVGKEEYNWDKIYKNIDDFKHHRKATMPMVDLLTDYVDELITDFKGIDMLIIKGLYSVRCKESKLKVFIELSYEEAITQNLNEEIEIADDFRVQIMNKEQEIVQQLKKEADFYIDFGSSNEIFHL